MNTPQQTVTQLFVATDQQNWEAVTAVFAETVTLDYASMNGNPASALTPEQIVTAWQGILPGFEHTHHQLGNFLVEQTDTTAHVHCYGTASHYLPHEDGNVWLVVGSYDLDLKQRENGTWAITAMTFNFKYQDGNTALAQAAIKNVQNK